jgi:hypothetical protein
MGAFYLRGEDLSKGFRDIPEIKASHSEALRPKP